MVNSRDYEPAEVASCELQLRESPNSRVNVSQCNQEGNTSFTTPEKAMEDGYNWRKYGQKLVKGNEFVRSYYKCTYSLCQVKKQVERSHDGKITDTIYIGKHDHPKPLLGSESASDFKGERPDMTFIKSTEGKSFNAHGKASHRIEPHEDSLAVIDDDPASEANSERDVVENDYVPDSKRWKKEYDNVDVSVVDKPNNEPRVVVHTLSEVETVNDGYRWRKYGQKLVKGNLNPRSYYRCSNGGCPVKKQVERASHDPKLLIATYEGQHDHDLPHATTVAHNPSGPDVNPAPLNNVLVTKSEEGDIKVFDVVVHFSACPESILQNKKQLSDDDYISS